MGFLCLHSSDGCGSHRCLESSQCEVCLGFCILAAIGNYGELKSSIGAWKTMEQSTVTAGLYASPTECRRMESRYFDGKR